MKHEVLVIAHTLLILLAWTSPFWLDWKIILICLVLYFLQIFIFKSCVLTNFQFESKVTKKSEMTMYTFWAETFGFKPDRKRLKFVSSYIMPLIILIITILWQIILKMPVIIKV